VKQTRIYVKPPLVKA